MDLLIALPILTPLLTAVALLLSWNQIRVQRLISLVGTTALLLVAVALLLAVWSGGIQATQIGNWPAPFGITLVADLFSAIMVTITGVMALAVAVYALVFMDDPRQRYGYHPLFFILLMGVCGAFLTGDMFNLYVWFEVMLISSFVLLALGGTRVQLEGAFKYVTLNLVSSAIFLTAVGILYSLTGTLNLADLSQQLGQVEQPGLVSALAMLFLVSFGIKAALFPLFFWLPDSYHTPPIPVTTIFSALLTKVGVYALVRVFTLLFVHDLEFTHTLLLIIAGLTMVTGVLGAVAQTEFRRLLSFHIISQIGYLLMGLGLFTTLALAGTVFFMAHVILTKSALFLVSGVVHRLRGTYDLKKLGGLYRSNALLATLFLIPAFSLAGIPPLSGFWAKLALVRAGLDIGQYIIVAVALGVSVLTLFSMTKIWAEVFWKPAPDNGDAEGATLSSTFDMRQRLAALAPLGALVLVTVVLGVLAEPFFTLALQAAEQLLNPTAYVGKVLAVLAGGMV